MGKEDQEGKQGRWTHWRPCSSHPPVGEVLHPCVHTPPHHPRLFARERKGFPAEPSLSPLLPRTGQCMPLL